MVELCEGKNRYYEGTAEKEILNGPITILYRRKGFWEPGSWFLVYDFNHRTENPSQNPEPRTQNFFRYWQMIVS